MTDRASAEELREAARAMWYVHTEDQRFAGPVSADPYGDFERALLAALRDTGPRPEPIATLSLYEQGRRQTLMDLGFDIDGIDTATAVEAARGLREALQRLVEEVSNPFDPDNEPPSLADARAALRDTGSRPDSDRDCLEVMDMWRERALRAEDALTLSGPRPTDRASAEGLRVILDDAIARHGGPPAYRDDLCRCGRFDCPIRAALHSSESDSGIDALRAENDELRALVDKHRATRRDRMRRYRARARLSTPRTETSDG